MQMFSLSRTQRYGIAILGVVIVAALRLALDPILGQELPTIMFIFAVILTAWYGGLWPGLLVTALSILLGEYLFIAPRGEIFRYENPLSQEQVITLGFVGTAFSLLFDRMREGVKAEFEYLENFRLLIEGARDYAIFRLDPQGRVSSWNSGAERITGYKENEISGRDISVFFTPEELETGAHRRGLEIATAEGQYEGEGWRLRKDGSRFWANVSGTALRDARGGLRGFVIVARDMTEPKLAEEALRESRRFAQNIIEVSPSVIYIFDVNHRKFVFINRRVADVVGHDLWQIPQETEFVNSLLHPDDQKLLPGRISQLASLQDGETTNFECRLRHAGGEWRWYHGHEKVFKRNEDGGVREIIGTLTDITERKRAEEMTEFINALNERLRPLSDPEEIKLAAARMLGDHLSADRCAYAEIMADENFLEITGDYTSGGTPSIVGRFTVDDLGPEVLRLMRANSLSVINDVEVEVSNEASLYAFRQVEIQAMVCAPITKRGRFVARMSVQQKTPRRWLPEEVELIKAVANRCWESVARARALRSLRESDDRYRAFIAQSSEAIWRYELEKPVPVSLPEDEQIEMFYRFSYLAECNDAMAKVLGYDSADQVMGARLGDPLARPDPRNIPFFREFKRAGYCLTNYETRGVDRGGNTKYFLNNLTGIVENGALIRAWGTSQDITGRKQAELALRESEERMRRITDATQDALWEIDLKTKHLWWSEGAIPLFGHSPAVLEIGLEDWYNGIHPEDVDQVQPKFETFLQSGDLDWTDEYRFRRADGSYAYIQDRGRKYCDESGTPTRIAGAMADITERKRSEKLLRQSNERFERFMQYLPGLAWIKDSEGRYVFANAAAVKAFRTTLEGLYGKADDEIFPPETAAQFKESDRQALTGEAGFLMVETLEHEDGELHYLAVNKFPIPSPDAAAPLIGGIAIDITESKRTEEALRVSEEQARRQLAQIEAIYASAPVGLCFVDTEQRFININDRLAEINGKSVEEHLGRTVREAAPAMAEAVEPIFRRVIETAEPVLNTELSAETVAQPDGARHFIASYYPIKSGDGRVAGVNMVVVEITQRKKIEEERERLLRQEKAARGEAEVANRMKDEFLATISHELRTPLTSILGWARMLARDSLTESEERHAVEVIAKSAQSQSSLIDDILDTSRIIAGRLTLAARPVEIEGVFQAAVDVVRPSAEAKRIALQVVIDCKDGVVLGDSVRLQQAIWNLLSNAVKFTNEGGRIEARLALAGDQIEITISDTGVGIEPQFLPYVFNRFRQADSTSTRRYGGLGLGLSIARHIVEMHGGCVSASSPGEGQGATFKIRIPVASGQDLQQPQMRQPESEVKQAKGERRLEERLKLDGVRVLIVEDNPDTLEMLKFIFDECGAEVITAASVSEALESLECRRPDALVSDIAMPNQDGYDLIRRARSRGPERGGKIPAVAVTACASTEDRVRSLAAGFQMHVAKPIDPGELIAVVASLVGRIHF